VARIELSGADLIVRLSLMEKAGAVHADVRIPLQSVRAVRVAQDPWSALRIDAAARGTG
jgi:hypothetical protein